MTDAFSLMMLHTHRSLFHFAVSKSSSCCQQKHEIILPQIHEGRSSCGSLSFSEYHVFVQQWRKSKGNFIECRSVSSILKLETTQLCYCYFIESRNEMNYFMFKRRQQRHEKPERERRRRRSEGRGKNVRGLSVLNPFSFEICCWWKVDLV